MNNSKMFLVTILSITTVLLASYTFAPLASAQYQYQDQGQGPQGGQSSRGDNQERGYQGQGGQGFQGQGFQRQGGSGFQGTRTEVSGTYTNSNFGVQITLPDGWTGFEMKQQSGNARVTIAPGGFSTTQGVTRPPVTIGISIMQSNSQSPQFMPRNMPGVTCTNSTTTNTVNGLNLNVVTMDCTGTNQNGDTVEMKSKTETGQVNSANIVLTLRANSSSGYDSQVGAFDDMVNSIQVSTPTQTMPSTQPNSQQPVTDNTTNGKIPNWVKGIFGMYAQGQLSDNDLVQAIQFLIKQGIIKIQ